MYNLNNTKVTVGKESVAGTAVARTAVIPMEDMCSINKKADKVKDPAIVGNGMATGNVLQSYDVGGDLPIAFRPVSGVGLILKSLLGTERTVVQVGGAIRVKYTGSEASCKMEASDSGDSLNSKVGDLGSEANDSGFGSSGDIDLTDAATDTLSELVAVINAYSDYSCEKIFGVDALDVSTPIDIVTQAAGKWAIIFFGAADSGVYLHSFVPDLTVAQRPTLSIQSDGIGDNYLYNGCVVDSLNLSAALKALVKAKAVIMGFNETGGQSASALNLEDVDPMMFANGLTSFGAVDFVFTRSLTLDIKNNHNAEGGYGQGSYGRQANLKAGFVITGELVLRMDLDSLAERGKTYTTETVSLLEWFKGKDITDDIPEMAIFELPWVGISTNDPVNNSDTFDISYAIEAFKAKGTTYDDPFVVHLLTQDSAAY